MNADIIGPAVRIFLRYFGAALMAKAGLSVDLNDPDLVNFMVMMVGAASSAIAETWYYLAKKRGWSC